MTHTNKLSASDIEKAVEKACAHDDQYDKYHYKYIDKEESVSVLFGEFNEEYQLDCCQRVSDMSSIFN